jgi:hypothetical protein
MSQTRRARPFPRPQLLIPRSLMKGMRFADARAVLGVHSATRFFTSLALLLAFAPSFGCTNTTSGFPAEWARRVCAKAYECCAPEELTGLRQYFGQSEEECRTNVQRQTDANFDELRRAIGRGAVTWSDSLAEQCLEEVAQQSCDDLKLSYGGPPAVCSQVRQANVKPGGSCCRSYECTTGWCWEDCFTGSDDLGFCQVHPVAGEGQTCNDGYGPLCEDGLFCGTSSPRVCVPQLKDGEPCDDGRQCSSGRCNAQDGGTRNCGPPQPWPGCGYPRPTF